MAPRTRPDPDYYRVLGVQPEATEAEIRRAYRRLALQWHPDRNPGNPAASERFKNASAAYAVLIDPAKRRDYDRARRAGAPTGFEDRREDVFRDLFADPRASAIFDELAREFERLGLRVDRHHFERTLSGGRTVVTGTVVIVSPLTPVLGLIRVAGALLRAAGVLPPSRAAERTIPPPRRRLLDRAARAGRWLLGLPPASPDRDLVVPLLLTAAEARHGGAKRVTLQGPEAVEELLVRIPPGVGAGTRLRLRGKGAGAPGQSRGDAYLVVEIRD